ncbi:NAD(P)-binding protein [Xylariaceae sp. FL0255]|nr:NAD(P)-binding protein [Xylariaceae sp. FL0255]
MATEKKILLITGANTGLGLEVLKALAGSSKPYEVIVGCRTISKGENAITEVKKEFPQTTSTFGTLQVDLNSDESLEKAVETVSSKYGRLDVLINNGGGSFDYDIVQGKKTIREAFNATWDLNVSGTQVLTTLAVPLLLKSSDPRLMFVTSGTASLEETERSDGHLARINSTPPAGWPKQLSGILTTAYRSSKMGLNMVMREWHRLLLNDGVKVWCISPGFLATGLAGIGAEKLKAMGALDPSVGGQFIKDVVEGARDHDVGKIIRRDMIQPW